MRSLNELLPRDLFDIIGLDDATSQTKRYLAVTKKTKKIAVSFLIDLVYDCSLIVLSDVLDSARKEVEFTEFFEKMIEEEGESMFGKYLIIKRTSIHDITPPPFDYSKVMPYKRSLTN